MSNPLLSIVIPTRDRPHLLPHAVRSALAQTLEDLEVIVVDDASTEPVRLFEHPRLRIIRLATSGGGAGARNVGTEVAQGRWISYLDDDDHLLPHMAQVSLEAIEKSNLPAPVGIISGIEVVDDQGKIISRRIPPLSRPQGSHFFLENLEPGKSYNTKQTLFVEREVIRGIGGWDETFRSRVHSEIFLRLNTVCSILGLPIITYQLQAHHEPRVSRNRSLRQESFSKLIDKHQAIFQAHPQMFANFVYDHALMSYRFGQYQAAFQSVSWAMRIHPLNTLDRMASPFQKKLLEIARLT